MARAKLKKNEERRIKLGHLWIFSNEIDEIAGNPNNGDMIEIYDSQEQRLGIGFFNRNSLIAVRLLSRIVVNNIKELFRVRMLNAYKLRKKLDPQRESFRMVFSESDLLPGLIVDKYNNTFVLQVNSFGMEKNIDLVVQILHEVFNAVNIFTKNDPLSRKLEGLTPTDTIYFGKAISEIVDDGLIKYKIDFDQAQKTGFYFDQTQNRFFIEKIVRGKTVADIFCNSGGFGLHALKAGASSVDFVDSSKIEIENVKENQKLNLIQAESNYYVMDAFEFLHESFTKKRTYDVVMIDPPAFAKSKKILPTAEKGYEKLNRLALQIVNDGGYLVSSSCSFHLQKENFLNCINRAAARLGKTLQLIRFSNASLDHPQLPAMPETNYLKFAVFKVFNE